MPRSRTSSGSPVISMVLLLYKGNLILLLSKVRFKSHFAGIIGLNVPTHDLSLYVRKPQSRKTVKFLLGPV
jgi:hypothetical protein